MVAALIFPEVVAVPVDVKAHVAVAFCAFEAAEVNTIAIARTKKRSKKAADTADVLVATVLPVWLMIRADKEICLSQE